MLNVFAKRIATCLCSRSYLKSEQYEWYVYVLEKKFVAIIGIFYLVLLGTVLSGLSSAIVFIGGFYILRSRAGGYHASNFFNCLMLSTATVILNIYIVSPLIIRYSPIAPIVMGFVCFIILEILGTVANPSTQLSKAEMASQCLLMRLITALQFAAIVILAAFEPLTVYSAHLASGMGFVAISSVIGKIKMRGCAV